jgi:hypothetical protein
MTDLRICCVAAQRRKAHVHHVNQGQKESLTMTALRTALSRFRAFLDVMDAAITASAAVRSHHAPAMADLRRLGIEPTRATMAAMSRA